MNDDVLFDLKQSSGSDSEAEAEQSLMLEEQKIEEEVVIPLETVFETVPAT